MQNTPLFFSSHHIWYSDFIMNHFELEKCVSLQFTPNLHCNFHLPIVITIDVKQLQRFLDCD